MKDNLSTWFLGIVAICLVAGLVICFLATNGFNTRITYSQEKIEVRAENSNSLQNNNWESFLRNKGLTLVLFLYFCYFSL